MTRRDDVVLTALDLTPSAQLVLRTGLNVGEMTGTAVEGVHVGTEPPGGIEPLESLARQSGVTLRRLPGAAPQALAAALHQDKVVAMTIGAGTAHATEHTVGPTARYVIEHSRKPVVVVPDAAAPRRGKLERILVPLEGTETSSRPVLDALCPLLMTDVELIVLHVFTEQTVPRMLDRPSRDLPLIGREFLARHCPSASTIELRPGSVAARVAEVCAEHDADMVVLSWSQDTSKGRAKVVREVLGVSALPVLLLPTSPGTGT